MSSNYNFSIENCKIEGFRYSQKYGNGSGYFAFKDRSGDHRVRFKVYDKRLVDIINANDKNYFSAKGDMELERFQDKPEPYSIRILQSIEVLMNEESDDDSIPF